MHTLEPSSFEVKIAIDKLKRCTYPGLDQILAELIQAGGDTLYSEIHNLINSIWNEQESLQQWKDSITVPIYRKGDKIGFSSYRISLVQTTCKLLFNNCSQC
jgi:hypothetical protein